MSKDDVKEQIARIEAAGGQHMVISERAEGVYISSPEFSEGTLFRANYTIAELVKAWRDSEDETFLKMADQLEASYLGDMH